MRSIYTTLYGDLKESMKTTQMLYNDYMYVMLIHLEAISLVSIAYRTKEKSMITIIFSLLLHLGYYL